MLVEVGYGQLLHVAERIAAKPEQRSLADVDHQAALQIGTEGTCQQDNSQFANGQGQRGIVGRCGMGERNDVIVDERLGEKGGGEGGHRRDESTRHDDEQTPFIFCDDHAKQPHNGLAPFLGKVLDSSCMSWAARAAVWIQCWGHMMN